MIAKAVVGDITFAHQLWKFIIPPCQHQRIKTWALFLYCDSNILVTSRQHLVLSLLHSTFCKRYYSCTPGTVTSCQPVGSLKSGLFCSEAKPIFVQAQQFIKIRSIQTGCCNSILYLHLPYISVPGVSVCNIHNLQILSNI